MHFKTNQSATITQPRLKTKVNSGPILVCSFGDLVGRQLADHQVSENEKLLAQKENLQLSQTMGQHFFQAHNLEISMQ